MGRFWTLRLALPRRRRRRPRGILRVGSLLSSGRSVTPVEQIMRVADLGYLTNEVTHMACPPLRYALGDKARAHWFYEDGGKGPGLNPLAGWSKPNIKNTIVNGVLTESDINVLDRAGTIEPAVTQNVSVAFDAGTEITKTTGQTDPAGGTNAIRILETTADAAHNIAPNSRNNPAGRVWTAVSFWVKPIGDRHVSVLIYNAWNHKISVSWTLTGAGAVNGAGGGATSGVPPTDAYIKRYGDWYYCSFTGMIFEEATILRLSVLNAAYEGSYVGDVTKGLYLSKVMWTEAEYPSSYVAEKDTVRQTDALQATGLSNLASKGAAVVVLRLPYAGSAMGANQYHWGLNGSDSKDDGVFIYTKASNDHLYAEIRSGGAKEAEIDLGAYSANTTYAIALDWDSTGLRACINGTEKTASGAITPPTGITQVEISKGVSADTASGAATLLHADFEAFNFTQAEREAATSTAMIAFLNGLAGIAS